MKTGKGGIELIKSFEGCRLKSYRDVVGVLTIGYGHTGNLRVGQVITQEEAERLLKQDLKRFEEGVNKYVNVPLNQNQFDALVSFCYNLGVGSLQKSTLLRKLNEKDYKGASNEFEKWNKAGGEVLRGLTRRRKAEKELFLKPVPKTTTKQVHTVVKGDTVSGLSVKYKTTIDKIVKLNPGLNKDVISTGQKIRVK